MLIKILVKTYKGKMHLKNTPVFFIFFFLFLLPAKKLLAESPLIDSLKLQLKFAPTGEKIDIMNNISRAYWFESPDSSGWYANEALNLAESLNDVKGMADALNRLGNAEYLKNNYSEAISLYTRSLDKRISINDLEGVSGSYYNLYLVYHTIGNSIMAIYYIQKAVDLGVETGYKSDLANYLNILGASQTELHDFENARNNLERAIEICKGDNDTLGIASAFSNMGNMYQRMSIYDQALEYFFKALNHYKRAGNRDGIAMVKNQIGTIHKKLDNLGLALEYYEQSLEIYLEQDKTQSGVASIMNNIGIIWYERKDYKTALAYYKMAFETYANTGYSQGIAATSNNMGMLYTREGNYDEALRSYRTSAEINENLGRDFNLANNYNNLGELFLMQKDYEKALEYLRKAIGTAIRLNAKELISENYLFQSQLFKETNDFEKSLGFYELFYTYQDSIYTMDAASRIAELQVRHNREIQEIELDLLQKDHDIQKLQIKRNHTMFWFYGGISMTTAIFVLIMLGLYRYKRKLKAVLELKSRELEEANKDLALSEENLQMLNNTKDKFFSILAHDLRNPFNALLSFSETLNQNYKDLSREQIYTYIDIIYKSATNLFLLLVNLLEWSKSQTGNIIYRPELFCLKSLVESEINNANANATGKNISLHIKINPEIKVFADKNLMATVIRNLLNNAVKFTHRDGKIIISANEKENHIEVLVSDNGIGIGKGEQKKLFNLDYNITTLGTNDEKGTGLGLILCKEFVEKNGGELTVTSEVNKGSTFIFTIPK